MQDPVLHTGTMTEVTGGPETHMWALRPGFQTGKEQNQVRTVGRVQNQVHRVGRATHKGDVQPTKENQALVFPPSKPLQLPCKPIFLSEACKAPLIWIPTGFLSLPHPCYAPARMQAATECLGSEHAQCARSHTTNVMFFYLI